MTFYVAALVAVLATVRVITCAVPVHALLYLVVSLLAVAVVFYTLGAPFAAMLEVIIYAGAIVVLFVFVVMMLNLGAETVARERGWLAPGVWLGPGVLSAVLLVALLWTFGAGTTTGGAAVEVGPKAVGLMLFTRYALVVELASLLLLAALVGAFHVARLGQSREPGR